MTGRPNPNPKRNQARELARRHELVAQMRARHNHTVHRLHLLRRTWSCPPPQPPPPPKQGSNSGDVLVYNKQGGGLMRR